MQTTLDVTAPTVEAAVPYVKDALPLVERFRPPEKASVLPSFAAVLSAAFPTGAGKDGATVAIPSIQFAADDETVPRATRAFPFNPEPDSLIHQVSRDRDLVNHLGEQPSNRSSAA